MLAFSNGSSHHAVCTGHCSCLLAISHAIVVVYPLCIHYDLYDRAHLLPEYRILLIASADCISPALKLISRALASDLENRSRALGVSESIYVGVSFVGEVGGTDLR